MTVQAIPTPGSAWSTRTIVLVTAMVTAAVTVVVLAAALAALTWPRDDVVADFAQPSSVVYDDGSEHHLSVIDRGPSWGLPIGDGHRYQLYAGRDPGGDYGHFLDLGVPEGALDGADVTWTADGARLVLGSGHEVLVPADAFTGGR